MEIFHFAVAVRDDVHRFGRLTHQQIVCVLVKNNQVMVKMMERQTYF